MYSRQIARDSAHQIPTQTRRAPWIVATLIVVALMAISACCATWLTMQAIPVTQDEQLRAAEDAAFAAGRITATAEMSQIIAAAYEQGRSDAASGANLIHRGRKLDGAR